MPPELRPYQKAAVEAAERHWATAGPRATVELPTGSGKTVVAAALIRPRLEAGGRVLVLAHRRELARQLAAGLERMTGCEAGIVLGSEGRADYDRRLVVAGIETLRRPQHLSRYLSHGMPALCMIDECHRAAGGAGGYECVLEGIPDAEVLGLTATPWRNDTRPLLCGPVVFARGLEELTPEWLAPLRWERRFVDDLHLDAVRIGQAEGERDFSTEDLSEELSQDSVVKETVGAALEVMGDRPTLVFAVDVAHAQQLAEAFCEAGKDARAVWGAMPDRERRETLSAWTDGRLQVATSVDVLSEGIDFPGLSCLLIARPTLSPGRYVQMIGRGTRLSPDKTDCVVIDLAGNPNYGGGRAINLGHILGIEVPAGGEGAEGEAGGRPRSVRLLDPTGHGPLTWVRGGRQWWIAPLLDDHRAFLFADPNESGLWWPLLQGPKSSGQRESFLLVDRPVPLRDGVGIVLTAARRAGLAASWHRSNALWRDEPMTVKQARTLGLEVALSIPKRDRTKGTAADLLTARFAERDAEHLLRRLETKVQGAR